MAPNGTAASRKTPTTAKASRDNDETSHIPLERLFDDLADEAELNTTDEVKIALPTVKKPGNWDSETIAGVKARDSAGRASPQMNKISPALAKAFAHSRPMADRPEILKCNHCKRAVSKHVMLKHVEGCLNKKQEKQRKKKEAKDARDAAARKATGGDSEDEEEEVDGKKPTGDKTGGLSASKKRKAGDGEEETGPAKKKKKKDERVKGPKAKAPVDVEKQCGVELPNGGQCARSLTCKSHSMGAKRAVRRSAPYDKLLLEYQRKNQAKLQKAQFDATAPNPDDESLPSGPVDSDEEKDSMMAAIQRSWGGQPLYHHTPAPLRSRYQHNRIKGMLQAALGGRKGASLFGTAGPSSGSVVGLGFFGANQGLTVDEPSLAMHAPRGPGAPGARSMMPPSASSRRPSAVAT